MANENAHRRSRRLNSADTNTDTRQRILEAARRELVARGSAGARIDRIARIARTSKERVYHYFQDKAHLVEEVEKDLVSRFDKFVQLDPEDVESFPASLFDYYSNNEEDLRLWLWFLLERGDAKFSRDDFHVQALKKRVGMVRQAQASGTIDQNWHPILLLNLLTSLSMSRVIAPSYVNDFSDDDKAVSSREMAERHRAAIIEIFRRMAIQAPASEQDAAKPSSN